MQQPGKTTRLEFNSQEVRSLGRRSLLKRLVFALGGAVAGQYLLPRAASAGSKVAKTQAGYKDAPRGGMRCDTCMQFEAPASCKLVDGVISPSGYCTFYAPKAK